MRTAVGLPATARERRCATVSICLIVIAALAALFPASPAVADGRLGAPRVTPIGTFGGIAYVQYDGTFQGRSSTGAYRVPYRITAPARPSQGNRTALVEPPHFAAGLGTPEFYLRREFLFSRGFAHAGVGYSTATFGEGFDRRILDPTAAGVFIHGGFADGNGRTDDEIIVDFARALAVDRGARRLVGRVDRRYITGFSDSSVPILRLITSGKAAGVFQLALPFTAEQGMDPQAALGDGRYDGKLIIVNSEADASADLIDRGSTPDQYRFYAVAGTPHVPDPLVPFFANMTTPASFEPALRAHFLQGGDWVIQGAPPPPSTQLATSDGEFERDVNGNAITIDVNGRLVPRPPFVDLGEARFVTGFLGTFDGVKTIQQLGFDSFAAYLQAFATEVDEYVSAGFMLQQDANAMRARAALCPPLTFTQTYRDHYNEFAAIIPCGQ